jgi:hypothetical protein
MPDHVRPLCPVEELHVDERSRAVITTGVDGDLDLEVLSAAWARTLDAHPTADSRIVPHGDGHALEPLGSAGRPGLIELAPEVDALTTIASAPLSVGGPVSQLWAAVRGSAATVGFTADHVVTDGQSALTLASALWRNYAAVLAGEPAAPPAATWPDAVSERLPAVSGEVVQALLAERLERSRSRPVPLLPYAAAGPDAPPAGQQPVHNTRITLSAERTVDLAAGARSLGTSVHGVTSAALLLAVHKELGGNDVTPLGCLSPFDLRSRVEPRVPADVMLSFVSSFPDVLDVGPGEGLEHLAALGRRINEGLRHGLADGGWATETALLAHFAEHPDILDTTVIVSNMGRIDGPVSPPGLRLHDTALTAAREDYFPQFGMGPLFTCVTAVDGAFAIDFPYTPVCFTPSQIDRLRTHTLATLQQVATAGAQTALPA